MPKKIMGNLVGPPNPRTVIDMNFEWGSSSKNAISHEAVANELNLMKSDIALLTANVDGNISLLYEAMEELSTQVNDLGDAENAEIHLADNCIEAFGVISSSLVCYLDNAQTIGFTSALYFTTPDTIPENYTTFPDNIYFKGDSTDEGAFVPEANMRYTIVFDFDGYMTNAYVSGVTTV